MILAFVVCGVMAGLAGSLADHGHLPSPDPRHLGRLWLPVAAGGAAVGLYGPVGCRRLSFSLPPFRWAARAWSCACSSIRPWAASCSPASCCSLSSCVAGGKLLPEGSGLANTLLIATLQSARRRLHAPGVRRHRRDARRKRRASSTCRWMAPSCSRAMTGFAVAYVSGSLLLGFAAASGGGRADRAAGRASGSIALKQDQVAIGFVLDAAVRRSQLVPRPALCAHARPQRAASAHPWPGRASRSSGRSSFDQNLLVYVSYLVVLLAWAWLNFTQPGLTAAQRGRAPRGGLCARHQRQPAALHLCRGRRRAGGPGGGQPIR